MIRHTFPPKIAKPAVRQVQYDMNKPVSAMEYAALKAKAEAMRGKCVAYYKMQQAPQTAMGINLVLGVVDDIKQTTRSWTGEPKCVLMVRLTGINYPRPWVWQSHLIDNWLAFDSVSDLHVIPDEILHELKIHDKLQDYLQTIESSSATQELRQRRGVV